MWTDEQKIAEIVAYVYPSRHIVHYNLNYDLFSRKWIIKENHFRASK
jgi:hypothetical protein